MVFSASGGGSTELKIKKRKKEKKEQRQSMPICQPIGQLKMHTITSTEPGPFIYICRREGTAWMERRIREGERGRRERQRERLKH